MIKYLKQFLKILLILGFLSGCVSNPYADDLQYIEAEESTEWLVWEEPQPPAMEAVYLSTSMPEPYTPEKPVVLVLEEEVVSQTAVSPTREVQEPEPVSKVLETEQPPASREKTEIVAKNEDEASIQEELAEEIPVYKSGEDIEIILPGHGWLVLGVSPNDKSVELLDRTILEDSTLFRFRTKGAGEYIIHFQQQDWQQGLMTYEDHAIKLLEDLSFDKKADFESDLAEESSEILTSEAEDLDAAFRQISLFDRLQAQLSNGTHETFTDLLETEDAAVSSMTDQELKEVLQDALQKNWINGLENILQRIHELNLANAFNDELLFRLAQLHEELGPYRDERKAYAYYELLMETFPLSSYWDKARERSLYIRRHYLNVF